jgi:hypothetical protein
MLAGVSLLAWLAEAADHSSAAVPAASALCASDEKADRPQHESSYQDEPEHMRSKAQAAKDGQDQQESNQCNHF